MSKVTSQLPAQLPSLDALRSVHVIGVCGTLMGAFAAYLKRRGVDVSGSDQNVYPPMSDVLRNAGVEVMSGFRAENITGQSTRPDLIVIGNVISANNPEARAAIDGGYVYTSLPEAMEKLLLVQTRNLVVAGTHGKTTTSSLLAHVLTQCKRDPSYFIGGVSDDLPFSFHLSSIDAGRLFVLEGDEYDTAFWDKVPKFNHYLPDDTILTSVEYDHADIYPDFEAVERAFEGLVSRVRPAGRLIACFDYPVIKKLTAVAKVPVLSYGASSESDARYTPGHFRFEADYSCFDVMDSGKKVDEVAIQLPGMHNALNALAVWIECHELGIETLTLREAFRSFRGVKRRQEVRADVNGIIVLDDFAHHPTAVRETLRALRLKYPKRRLLTVFEPRSATSRRKVFQKDYAAAFQEADVIFIASPYDQTKIASDDQFSSDMLIADLVGVGKHAFLLSTVEEGVAEVAKKAKSGDLIAVLSNGGFGGFIPKLIDSLKTRT
jgi:UDP-N-acetylmuramate: L-alanyl-gamma-D-glutamyl-meso-diaminopimelate ligase